MKLLAVTACTVGIAHTYIASEKLMKICRERDIHIKIETQGATGVENELTDDDINEADGIIIASDKAINLDRFQGKAVFECPVKRAITEPDTIIDRFINGKVPVMGNKKSLKDLVKSKHNGGSQSSFYKHLMSGVSQMIPFVVVSGLLIALSLTFGGETTDMGIVVPGNSFWKHIESIGSAGFQFMVPILSAFISYSIADKPGVVPGMIGGYIAANGYFYNSEADAGFLGGIITGFLAGYISKWLKEKKVPEIIRPIMPTIIIPITSTVLTGVIFIYLLGVPISIIFTGLTTFLANLTGIGAVALATILGAMIAVDMGGPVNKVAYLFGISMITAGHLEVMAAISVAISIPPIAMGLATFLNKNYYSEEELDAGKASFIMGLGGVTEGAIPFASADPLRVIPSIMIGSIIGSNISMLTGVTNSVPHGGVITALMGVVNGVPMFFIAIIVGSIASALLVNYLKGLSAR